MGGWSGRDGCVRRIWTVGALFSCVPTSRLLPDAPWRVPRAEFWDGSKTPPISCHPILRLLFALRSIISISLLSQILYPLYILSHIPVIYKRGAPRVQTCLPTIILLLLQYVDNIYNLGENISIYDTYRICFYAICRLPSRAYHILLVLAHGGFMRSGLGQKERRAHKARALFCARICCARCVFRVYAHTRALLCFCAYFYVLLPHARAPTIIAHAFARARCHCLLLLLCFGSALIAFLARTFYILLPIKTDFGFMTFIGMVYVCGIRTL